MFNKPGTAQVGAISKAQKDSKTTFSTTGDNKSSQKLKIEKKFSNFFRFFLNFPISRIVPKNVKGGTLWDFLNIHSVAKYQKLMNNTKIIGEQYKNFGKNEKFEQSHSAEKREKSQGVEKSGKGDPSALEWLFISC